MAKKQKPKKKPVSPALLAKLAGSVKTGQAFPQKDPPSLSEQTASVGVSPKSVKLTKAPNRTKKRQLVFRISDELAKELKDGAYTNREKQTKLVERAIRAEIANLHAKFPDGFVEEPPENET